jgi:anti-sigma B factor antagonist
MAPARHSEPEGALVGPIEMVTSMDEHDGKVVVSVGGDVDLVTSQRLRRVLEDAVQVNPQVEVDLTGLTFIDSSGLSALVEGHRAARDAGGVVVLRNPTPMLRRLLDITRLDSLLVVDDTDAATPTTEA